MRRLQLTKKEASTTVPQTPVHGPGGMLGFYGANPEIVSAMAKPSGLYEVLVNTPGGVRLSQFEQEKYLILTGQTAGSGSNPVAPCDDSPVAGLLKTCAQLFPFGRISQDSRTITLDQANLLLDRSEPLDYRLANQPMAAVDPIVPSSPAQMFQSDQAKAVLEMGNEFERRISPKVWTANPSNNTGSNGYMEPYGLQFLIQTGWRDVVTTTACPAADPLYYNFNANVTADSAATVRRFVNVFRDRRRLAEKLGLSGVVFAWVMPQALLDQLADIWPCNWPGTGCTVPSNTAKNMDVRWMQETADGMRSGRYLPIDGVNVPVIVDDTLPETYVDGDTYTSDAYLLPMQVPALTGSNGRAIFLEFADMRKSLAAELGSEFILPGQFEVRGGGRFLVFKKGAKNVCVQFGMVARWRLVVRTPFLCARIANLSYDFTYHSRAWDPAGNPTGYNFVNGGATTRTAPTVNAPRA